MAPSHPYRPKHLAFLLTALLSTSEGRADLCNQYTSCASCTEAGTVADGIAMALSRRHLRLSADRSPIVDDSTRSPVDSCYWCPSTSTCNGNSTKGTIQHRYECPSSAAATDSTHPDLLPNWMGTLLNYTSSNDDATDGGGLASLTLLDLSLPGTHDTLTYDLSLTVSTDGMDAYTRLDRLLHFFSGGTVHLLPGELEEFLRRQAQTQRLDVVSQLNGGIRFLDVRIMMEQGEGDGDAWYGIHFMQSVHPAMVYLSQVREWLDDHPHEIVVIWLSKHGVAGATGTDQYPDVPISAKRKFWDEYCQLFDGLMFDSRHSTMNETTIGQLVRENYRLVTLASDYKEFTNSSHLALDGASIDNWVHGEGAFDEIRTLDAQREYFQGAPARNRVAKASGRFTLMGMNTEGTGYQIIGAAEDKFLPHSIVQIQLVRLFLSLLSSLGAFLGLMEEFASLFGNIYLAGLVDSCPSRILIPGVKRWCPPTLLDVGQLSSYYDQIAIEEAFLASFASPNGGGRLGGEPIIAATAFPNAFYLDALDQNGTIRTGKSIDGSAPAGRQDTHRNARYAYVDTVISYNVEMACRGRRKEEESGVLTAEARGVQDCYNLRRWVSDRRATNPLQLWDDPEYGRHSDWPKNRTTN